MLSQDYIWSFMDCVEPMGIHIFDGGSQVKLHKLHKTMLGASSGVSTGLL